MKTYESTNLLQVLTSESANRCVLMYSCSANRRPICFVVCGCLILKYLFVIYLQKMGQYVFFFVDVFLLPTLATERSPAPRVCTRTSPRATTHRRAHATRHTHHKTKWDISAHIWNMEYAMISSRKIFVFRLIILRIFVVLKLAHECMCECLCVHSAECMCECTLWKLLNQQRWL